MTQFVLLQQRKLMSKKEYKGRHHNWGGLLMGLGTATAVAGPVNTYLRSGTFNLFVYCCAFTLAGCTVLPTPSTVVL